MLRLQVGASNSETIIHRGDEEQAGVSQECMRALKLGFVLGSKRKTINIVLPKLHHGTGEIRGVPNGVVGVTLLCVPWVVA